MGGKKTQINQTKGDEEHDRNTNRRNLQRNQIIEIRPERSREDHRIYEFALYLKE